VVHEAPEQAGRLRSRQELAARASSRRHHNSTKPPRRASRATPPPEGNFRAFARHHRKSKKSKIIPKICGNLRHLRLKKSNVFRLYSFCYWLELFILRALWRAVTIKIPHSAFRIPNSSSPAPLHSYQHHQISQKEARNEEEQCGLKAAF
jgi:hypothetical protein